ncbi:hypothetical protein GCM10008955_40500 [Deinococcus malanensis]|uniref:Uncharacterized protein n=1 Tax=Deinococcus malanensis TaxID=1706855 RepID=A0ABQ2F1Z1_9DEIO|nr:hypothetical protein GCM10008955_40500 [Deinococcus malanensis]
MVNSRQDLWPGETYDDLSDAYAFLLVTNPVPAWGITLRKWSARPEVTHAGREGVYRRPSVGNRWLWWFVGESVEIMLEAESLNSRCPEIFRIGPATTTDQGNAVLN